MENQQENKDVNIFEIAKQVNKELSSLIDSGTDDDVNTDNYSGNPETLKKQHEKQIKKILLSYYEDADVLIKNSNVVDAIRTILGMYEGTFYLPEFADPFDIYPDGFDIRVKEIMLIMMRKLILGFETIASSDEDILFAYDLIFDRFSKYQDFAVKINEKAAFDIADFADLLNTLLINETVAEHLYELIQDNDLECFDMVWVLLKIARLTRNENLWNETLDSFAELDPEIQKLCDQEF